MSLILEALKKSERQRRLGESPSLGSPIMAVRRRRNLLPALVVLILIGLVALWWFRRETVAPEADPAVPAIVATAPAPVVQDATTFNDNPVLPPPVTTNAPREVAQSSAALRQPRSKVPADATTGGLTPDQLETLKSDAVVVPNAQTPKSVQPAAIDDASQAAAAAGADDAVQEQRAAEAALAEATAAARGGPDKPAAPVGNSKATPAAAPSAPATTAASPASGEGIKLMWELPFATRRELPEVKLTMHVYADQPTQRFVIINGDRQVEGDEVGSLNLIEIRRDGVVFDFKGVRFLYPRGGR